MTGAPIVLAAGGTGGHLFPAEALARELLSRGRRVVLVTDRRAAAFKVDDVPVAHVRAATVLPGLAGKARTAIELGFGAVQAIGILRRLRPAAVVGFGGYPSLPTAWAAARMGIPLVLHEQNAVLGRANRILAGGAVRVCTGFEQVTGLADGDRSKLVHTGNPVRPAIAALRDRPYAPPVADGPFAVLVTGGSQGAAVFSEIVPAAVRLLPASQRARLTIVQQARAETLETARAAYAQAGVSAELSPFFADMAERLGACHLMICRAGASTIAELSVAGRPALLVPYPHAIADEQTANAEQFVAAGGGSLMPQAGFTAEALAARLEAKMALPAELADLAAAARAFGHADAAVRLADVVLDAATAAGLRSTATLREIAA
jgi:UDP-N-acetylglucosamine--N-acetylmuramyl-(pentapeptide) pyrophosphoryl-undecaprenol N-acetylglucosamine transferase